MSNPSRKRLKVSVACDECRLRKIKCNGARPICNHCAKRKSCSPCRYTNSRAKEDLLSRWPPKPNNRGPLPIHASMNLSQSVNQLSRLPIVSAEDSSTSHPPAINSSTLEGSSNFVDSMNGVVGDSSDSPEVFGSSSAGSFMRQIKAGIDARLGNFHSIASMSHHTNSFNSHATKPKRPYYGEDAAYFSLPPRGLADCLMEAYWNANWSLYPFVNRNEIKSDYEAIWIGGDLHCNEYLTMSIINTCFALGCQYSDAVPVKQRRRAGEEYFTRAQYLYGKVTGIVSPETVQCLLLMGVDLQSTSEVHQCWMVVGQAIRMAQSIGLHLPHYCDDSHSIRHREYARRVWHGCVLLDRVLSMTFGRPGMIPKWLSNGIPLPAMIDDEFLDTQQEGSVTRPDGDPCIMAFSVKALELYSIMNDILLKLYMRDGEQRRNAEELSRILGLDEQLQNWHDSLPSFLRILSEFKLNGLFQRQAILSRLRYLHVRILLLRPVLARSWHRFPPNRSSDQNEGLTQIMISQCSSVCFQAAHELIDIFKNSPDLESLSGPLPAWWYSILYLYTAATVILAERLRNHNLGADSVSQGSRVSTAWEDAISVLKEYGNVGGMADRCVATLEVLSAKLSLNPTQVGIPESHDNLYDGSSGFIHPHCEPDATWNASTSLLGVDDMVWLSTMSGNLY